jgi:phospholipid/cholesterol/gamma-HCH transport system substrate-binding protein
METRANYLLIGAFTLAGFVGLLLFFLWFGRVQLDRQFAYYDVIFSTVEGLSNASEVRFSGLPVGQVVSVGLDPEGTGQIRVRLEVAAGTPVRTSSVATIEASGVTGVSHVGITSGDPRDPLLTDASDDPIPDISSGRSVLQSLSEDAPAILEQILTVSQSVSELLGPVNQERVSQILANLEASSGDLQQALADFSSVTESVAAATGEISAFTSRLETISNAATTTLETADETLRQVTSLAARAETTLDAGDAALRSGTRTLDSADLFIREELPGIVTELEETLASVRGQVDTVGNEARAMLIEFSTTGAVATNRLRELEETIGEANRMIAEITTAVDTVNATAASAQAFIENDATALTADARTLIGNANEVVAAALDVAETDLPAIIADVRQATETASRTIESVGASLTSAAGRTDQIAAEVEQTFRTVADTFENANGTLTRLNTALETGDGALAAAERAFTSADRVLNSDVATITSRLEETLGRLETAIDTVTADVPQISADLRETAARANATLAQVQSTADSLAPPLSAFATQALPQYTRLAGESRQLVDNLTRLVRQIERDPARYFLGGEAPAFRR